MGAVTEKSICINAITEVTEVTGEKSMSAEIFREWLEGIKYKVNEHRELPYSPVTSVILLPSRKKDRIPAALSPLGEVTAEPKPPVTAVTSSAEIIYLFAERAGIMEYDAGLPRAEAEQLAWLDVSNTAGGASARVRPTEDEVLRVTEEPGMRTFDSIEAIEKELP
jgi:hypothetical protein